MDSNQEIEIKYNLPQDSSIDEIANEVYEYIKKMNWKILAECELKRIFHYYDTESYAHLEQGNTLRMVELFDQEVDKGNIRIDYKTGDLEYRIENNFWKNEKISPKEIKNLFNLEEKISEVKICKTKHKKIEFMNQYCTFIVEAAIDHFFDIEGNLLLKELEFELKKGDPSIIPQVAKYWDKFKYPREYQQKYTKIMNL